MRRFILRLSVMMVAFVFGVGANALVDRGLGPIVERCTENPIEVPPILTILLTNVPACALYFQ